MDKDNKHPYLRIGYSYKIKVEYPLLSGDTVSKILDYRKDCIKDDHKNSATIIKKIPKYYGTVVQPNHINYKRNIKDFYNLYEPLSAKPKKGNCDTIISFLNHIFYENIDLGLDYLKILYENPTQLLPVLCLVSTERKTGKTTFLDLLKLIYGMNMTINSTQDFESQFNSDFKGKLIIAIEEVFFNKREETEKIKQLSTSKSFKSQAKGRDREETSFFGKIILVSNHETEFIKIDPGEDRFWVIKVKPFKNENVHLLNQMEKEIPAFLNYLLERQFSYPNKTRMWFDFSLYKTKALKSLVSRNNNKIEFELLSVILTIMEHYGVERVCFILTDVPGFLNKSYHKIEMSVIRKMVKEKWNLTPVKNSLSYVKYSILNDGTLVDQSSKGRYYAITKDWIKDNYSELMNY